MTSPTGRRKPAEKGPAATPTRTAGHPLLTDGSFLSLWLSGSLAGVLRWLELLAISIFVLERTGSPFLVALLTFLRMAPLFLCGIPAGALADRYDRRRLLIIGLVVLALASAILAALAGSGRIALWQIALGTFLNGVFWSSDFPVRRTMLGEIAGAERLSRAMALESATNNATRMLGPALGGVLIATLGLLGVYLVGAVLYAICVLLIVRLPDRSASAKAAQASFRAMLLEGWRFTRGHRVIVGALAVTLMVDRLGVAMLTKKPVIGERTLGL